MSDDTSILPPRQPKLESATEYNSANLIAPRPKPNQFVQGLKEGTPFVKEDKVPRPKGLGEIYARRFGRDLPINVGIGTGIGAFGGPAGAAAGALASVPVTAVQAGFGTAAEALDAPEWAQETSEIIGGLGYGLGRTVLGKTIGYAEKGLKELYKSAAKEGYEVGPGAKTVNGMKYGAGETEQSASRNLSKFTQEATKRAGSETEKVDSVWLDKTGKDLIADVDNIFAGKTFTSSTKFNKEISDIAEKAEGAFGEQGNVVKTILEKNIGGERPSGSLLGNRFAATDLRKAIVEINSMLGGNLKPNQSELLHNLKDSLENLAESNLTKESRVAYQDWRKKYNAYASIRDAFVREGTTGVNAAGQLNPKTLLDVLKMRTGGYPSKNPLYDKLAEFGNILKAKNYSQPTAFPAIYQAVSESPVSKIFQKIFQPSVETKREALARALQTYAAPIPRILMSNYKDKQ
jgi:hypothetical protein